MEIEEGLADFWHPMSIRLLLIAKREGLASILCLTLGVESLTAVNTVLENGSKRCRLAHNSSAWNNCLRAGC